MAGTAYPSRATETTLVFFLMGSVMFINLVFYLFFFRQVSLGLSILDCIFGFL